MSYYTVVDRPLAEVEAELCECADTWMPIAAYTANRTGISLLSEAGIKPFGRQRIRKLHVGLTGPSHSENGIAVFDFTWRAHGERKAPFLDGHLEIASLTPGYTLVTIEATYEPSPELSRLVPDHAVTHRIAQATLRDFSERVAHRLERGRLH